MRKFAAILVCLLIISGCIGGKGHNIKLNSEVSPSKVSLNNPERIRVNVMATNIGTSLEKITAEVVETEGLLVVPPNRTTFTLKSGESRTIIFEAALMDDAVPGDYIIDIQIKTEAGEIIQDRAKVRVTEESTLF